MSTQRLDPERDRILLQRKVLTPEILDILQTYHPPFDWAYILYLEIGNGIRDGNVRWDVDKKCWIRWDGTNWVEERDTYVFRVTAILISKAQEETEGYKIQMRLLRAGRAYNIQRAVRMFKLLVDINDEDEVIQKEMREWLK